MYVPSSCDKYVNFANLGRLMELYNMSSCLGYYKLKTIKALTHAWECGHHCKLVCIINFFKKHLLSVHVYYMYVLYDHQNPITPHWHEPT